MLLLDIGPPESSPERAPWLIENKGPCLQLVDDAIGAEMVERSNGKRYLRRNPHDPNDTRWGYMTQDGAFLSEPYQPVDPDATRARGTVQGEQRARERREKLRDD